MDYFAKPKTPKNDDLEVTGVSRSGRIRKKSSKLADFESDDLTEQKLKKHKAHQQQMAQQLLEKFEKNLQNQDNEISVKPKNVSFASPKRSPVPPKNPTPQRNTYPQRQSYEPPMVQYTQNTAQESTSENDEESSESESEDANDLGNGFENNDSSSESESEEEMDPLHISEEQINENPGFTKLEPPQQNDVPSQSKNSLYMLEKYRKKLIIKDGKVINKSPTKLQRKDKGKTRFTAYMLWAREVRPQLVANYPDLDFSGISKKLGEMWALVPNGHKYNWKRRAKRAALKPDVKNEQHLDSQNRKFLNKAGKYQVINLGNPPMFASDALQPTSPLEKDFLNDQGSFKVPGTQPIDIAAHLTLLGESLTLVGKRLREREGQITVSGSIPLLLDSLLCALGPLLCLTQQITEMNGASPENLSSILENVAYIMPGSMAVNYRN